MCVCDNDTMFAIKALAHLCTTRSILRFHQSIFYNNNNNNELIHEQYLLIKMTVCIQKRDRCRLCFSLILRDRSTLFSSICCQKYYHLFKHIKRTKIPIKKYNPLKIKISSRTVCFRDLILRYLRTQIEPKKNFSNFICYDCSMILLDIEQCAKYLRRTINQLKIKFNKSNRLVTSSLSATYQKKNQIMKTIKNETLPILESDDDEEFDDIDDDEETDEENDDTTKSIEPTNRTICDQSKSLDFTSSSSGGDSLLHIQRNNLTNKNPNNNQCNDDEDNDAEDEDDDDDDDDEEEEDGLVSSRKTKSKKHKQKTLSEISPKNVISNLNPSSTINPSDSSMNLLQETKPNILQLRLAQMMANAAAVASLSTGQNNNNNNNNDGNNVDTVMNTFANMQRNFLLKILSDPMAAARAAMSATQMKTTISPISLIESNNKQTGSGRKRKSTPEKRVITNYRSTNNNGNASPTIEHESMSNSTDNMNNQDRTDHPLELTLKSLQSSNRVLASPDVQNLVTSRKKENGSPLHVGQLYQHIDEDPKESTTPNDSSVSLSSSLIRHSTLAKRQRLSTSGQYDSTNTQNKPSMINMPQATSDLLSPNHHQTTMNDDNNSNIHQRQQQRKLDPRSCAECGKVLFSDRTLLLHCQTHAKNEKQCWICGINDDSIKKHIINEHGNQKITNTGFKCQHCDRVFPVFADLENHTKEHSKKKPFECPICNKRFGQQGNLSCHLRIHSGVKPFTCSSCGKAFRHSNSLRRHARTVHSASRGLTTTNSLLPSTTTSLSNDIKVETYDDVPSSLMIPSDDGSSSTGGIPSPSISNAQVDSDSHE
ncbi:unnamed protein product [Rotaria sp. Silwood2]|nr:unnamed protein product [Rotaria sp. Silwood2]CAF3176329.1 unnamed protein product [Rotaria sp. Silwood2]